MTNSRKELSFSGHTHSNYALTSHTHSNYALTNHTHSEYAASNHTHSQYMTEAQVTELIDEKLSTGLSVTKILGKSDLVKYTDDYGRDYYDYRVNLISLLGFTPKSVTVYNTFVYNCTAEDIVFGSKGILNKSYTNNLSSRPDQTIYPGQRIGVGGDTTYGVSINYGNYVKLRINSFANIDFSSSYILTIGFRSGYRMDHKEGGYSDYMDSQSICLHTVSVDEFYCKLLILGESSN